MTHARSASTVHWAHRDHNDEEDDDESAYHAASTVAPPSKVYLRSAADSATQAAARAFDAMQLHRPMSAQQAARPDATKRGRTDSASTERDTQRPPPTRYQLRSPARLNVDVDRWRDEREEHQQAPPPRQIVSRSTSRRPASAMPARHTPQGESSPEPPFAAAAARSSPRARPASAIVTQTRRHDYANADTVYTITHHQRRPPPVSQMTHAHPRPRSRSRSRSHGQPAPAESSINNHHRHISIRSTAAVRPRSSSRSRSPSSTRSPSRSPYWSDSPSRSCDSSRSRSRSLSPPPSRRRAPSSSIQRHREAPSSSPRRHSTTRSTSSRSPSRSRRPRFTRQDSQHSLLSVYIDDPEDESIDIFSPHYETPLSFPHANGADSHRERERERHSHQQQAQRQSYQSHAADSYHSSQQQDRPHSRIRLVDQHEPTPYDEADRRYAHAPSQEWQQSRQAPSHESLFSPPARKQTRPPPRVAPSATYVSLPSHADLQRQQQHQQQHQHNATPFREVQPQASHHISPTPPSALDGQTGGDSAVSSLQPIQWLLHQAAHQPAESSSPSLHALAHGGHGHGTPTTPSAGFRRRAQSFSPSSSSSRPPLYDTTGPMVTSDLFSPSHQLRPSKSQTVKELRSTIMTQQLQLQALMRAEGIEEDQQLQQRQQIVSMIQTSPSQLRERSEQQSSSYFAPLAKTLSPPPASPLASPVGADRPITSEVTTSATAGHAAGGIAPTPSHTPNYSPRTTLTTWPQAPVVTPAVAVVLSASAQDPNSLDYCSDLPDPSQSWPTSPIVKSRRASTHAVTAQAIAAAIKRSTMRQVNVGEGDMTAIPVASSTHQNGRTEATNASAPPAAPSTKDEDEARALRRAKRAERARRQVERERAEAAQSQQPPPVPTPEAYAAYAAQWSQWLALHAQPPPFVGGLDFAANAHHRAEYQRAYAAAYMAHLARHSAGSPPPTQAQVPLPHVTGANVRPSPQQQYPLPPEPWHASIHSVAPQDRRKSAPRPSQPPAPSHPADRHPPSSAQSPMVVLSSSIHGGVLAHTSSPPLVPTPPPARGGRPQSASAAAAASHHHQASRAHRSAASTASPPDSVPRPTRGPAVAAHRTGPPPTQTKQDPTTKRKPASSKKPPPPSAVAPIPAPTAQYSAQERLAMRSQVAPVTRLVPSKAAAALAEHPLSGSSSRERAKHLHRAHSFASRASLHTSEEEEWSTSGSESDEDDTDADSSQP